MKVYLVFDLSGSEDDLVGVYANEPAAREGVYNFLRDETGYTAEDWEEFADDNGYDSVSDFQEAIRQMPDYDEEMMIEVREETVIG